MEKIYVLLFSLLALSACQDKKDSSPPNIVFILTDDQGWGDLSLNGNADVSTPHIDKLAADGAVFDRFYVSPVCSPTRAEILTGRYAVRSGVYSTSEGGERIDLDEKTMADVFKENAYKTAAFGKWHSGMQYPYHPIGRGFEEFYGFCSGHWGDYFSPMLERNGEITQGDGFLPDDLTSEALRFIERQKEESFFLYLPLNTPHSPMQVPDEWWTKHADADLTMVNANSGKEKINKTKAAYALAENIDWNVGRITKRLKELSLTENTIVIYLSDNGPNGWRWNGNMKGTKGSTDEGGVRSPFIISWKGMIAAGKKIPQIASALDLLPTLAALSDISFSPQKSLDGISLKPLLLNENTDWEDRLLVSHWNSKTSVRSQNFRLDHENGLFDMRKDPSQNEDIAANEKEIFEKLLAFKTKWEAEVLTELPAVDQRTFPIGHPDFKHYQLPARDAKAHGNIKRSNRWPNDSFFTNWVSVHDSITWDIEVLEDGDFEVEIYYTCKKEDVGATISLSYGENSIKKTIIEAHDPPLEGYEMDRLEREESYTKDFKPVSMGNIFLNKGQGQLALKANELKGEQLIDFRLLMLHRIKK
jgi:arylsulfatase A-like enzyme